MLFIHPCKAIFFYYIMMYILNILFTIKKGSMKELKDVIFQNCYRWIGFPKESSYYLMKHQKKKDLLLIATKLIKKYFMLVLLKNIIIVIWRKKHKIGKTVKNNYSATENCRKPKHCWHKIGCYRTSKNFA